MKARKMQEAETAESGVPMITPQALCASSPKGVPLRYAGNFTSTAKSRPLGEGGFAQQRLRGYSRARTLSVIAARCHLPREGEVLLYLPEDAKKLPLRGSWQTRRV